MPALRTPKSCAFGQSVNSLLFNEDDDRIASKHHVYSVFAAGRIRTDGRECFEKAISRIASGTDSALCQCMKDNHCNKSTAHNYTQLYHELLEPHRTDTLSFLEVGIGTNNQDVPSSMAPAYPPGASLRGWRSYFRNPRMNIMGADVDSRILFQEQRIVTGYINQLSPTSIFYFAKQMGLVEKGLDFVLDDGLHEYRSNLILLIGMWPFIKTNGLYVIEDMAIGTFTALIKFFGESSLGADWGAFELPSEFKSDNRAIVLQKR
jgi:hypothetical protein